MQPLTSIDSGIPKSMPGSPNLYDRNRTERTERPGNLRTVRVTANSVSYLSSFIRFTWLSAGACPVFVAATEREIRVRTLRQTVPINARFWPRVQRPRPYCASITSVPSSVLGFIASPHTMIWQISLANRQQL